MTNDKLSQVREAVVELWAEYKAWCQKVPWVDMATGKISGHISVKPTADGFMDFLCEKK